MSFAEPVSDRRSICFRETAKWKLPGLVLAALSPGSLLSCSVCYGEPDSPVSRGLTWAIIALAAIVMMVLAGAVAFFVQANRKASVLQATESATALIEKT